VETGRLGGTEASGRAGATAGRGSGPVASEAPGGMMPLALSGEQAAWAASVGWDSETGGGHGSIAGIISGAWGSDMGADNSCRAEGTGGRKRAADGADGSNGTRARTISRAQGTGDSTGVGRPGGSSSRAQTGFVGRAQVRGDWQAMGCCSIVQTAGGAAEASGVGCGSTRAEGGDGAQTCSSRGQMMGATDSIDRTTGNGWDHSARVWHAGSR
jgi:hypothetical protein